MYGILTNIEYEKHWIFKNYYYSLINVFGENNVKRVQSIDDLFGLDVLFIGDEHFMPNKEIWMNDSFIDRCNSLKIFVFIFNNEKIFNSKFPWNEGIQKNVNKFKFHKQFVYDIDDSLILNTDINKTFMSKFFIDKFDIQKVKLNKTIFFGKIQDNYDSYKKRREFLEKVKMEIDLDIIESNDSISSYDYFRKISEYKFILSPLGNGNFVPMRYYESLFTGSIPLQESTEGINHIFKKEIDLSYGIFFNNVNELIEKIKNYENKETFNYYMEDFINEKIKNILNL